MTIARVLWRRLDVPGHETARVERVADGWRLSGVASFAAAGAPCRLEYTIDCDERWVTRRCEVTGWIGRSAVATRIEHDGQGAWTRDGVAVPDVAGCVDVDLAFSPVTNMLPIRRLALEIGASASARAAWLRIEPTSLEPLEQTYTRIAENQYLYQSDGGAFRRTITVDAIGLVLEYPQGWVAEESAVDP